MIPVKPPSAKESGKHVVVEGIEGKRIRLPVCKPLLTKIGESTLEHSFVVSPTCLVALLGRDVLTKLQAEIFFRGDQIVVKFPVKQGSNYQMALRNIETVLRAKGIEILNGVDPCVWADGTPARARAVTSVKIPLKEGEGPMCVRQYPLRRATRIGLKPLIEKFKGYGWLVEGSSPFNTPILGVPKPYGTSYRLVQDLRAVNKKVLVDHPMVPNPHTILTQVPAEAKVFTVLDLKDAFFSIPLHEDSWKLFAFEWEDPDTHHKTQLLWTVLPQGFGSAPHIFGTALQKDLEDWKRQHPEVALLQYVDDLLIAGPDMQKGKRATVSLLNVLGKKGYKVSQEKAQICQPKVTFLGYEIEKGVRALSKNRIQAIQDMPAPTTPKELWAFLGLTGFCRMWIPDYYGGKAKPLYESLTKEGLTNWKWTRENQHAFELLKAALMQPPALMIPNGHKPYRLYVHENKGIASGVLTQPVGPTWKPVGYYSKVLDPVAKGWLTCLRAVAATATIVEEAQKIVMGTDMVIHTPHGVPQILEGEGGKFLNPSRQSRYEIFLLSNPGLTFKHTTALNPATLLPELGPPCHDCLEVLSQTVLIRPDLKDDPLENPEEEFFVDGSSSMIKGCAVVTLTETVWKEKLPASWSAQAAELTALTRALEMGRDKRVNIFTDSRYAFATMHAHGLLWKERGFITAAGQRIANGPQIVKLLEALRLPREVAVVHVKAHGRAADERQKKGNAKADAAAKEAALMGGDVGIQGSAHEVTFPLEDCIVHYFPMDNAAAKENNEVKNKNGWWIAPGGKVMVPRPLLIEVLLRLHASTHMGGTAMGDLLVRQVAAPGLYLEAQRVAAQCPTCLKDGYSINSSTCPTAGPDTMIFAASQLSQIKVVILWGRFAVPFQSLPLDAPIHAFQPRDQVLVQKWKKDPLTEKFEGPYQVLLTTHTAVKLAGSDKWTHCSRIKKYLSKKQDNNSQEVATPRNKKPTIGSAQ
ncbi:uncharacterized protein LOC142829503 [Pelodiscus sinensis]|uniref:uncharacterized protein LOC142829503 n=1 Tax=Pelodiscus sinensis TaxID=13735 RepID=UPI003F6B3843